jgi:HK97 family phage major capsid protein
MARNTYEAWIPEEFGSQVIQKVNQVSAVENYAQRIPMQTQTRSTPRSGGVGVGMVAKGAAYSEDTTANDEVVLREQKFGQAVRIAEEDIADSLADIVNTKTVDWATAYAKILDNACLAVTAAKASSGCAFDSLYYLLSQTDSATSYTANANITQTATGAPAITYANLSAVANLYESGDFFDEAASIVIAHPKYKGLLRGVLDSQNRPIFQEGSTGVPGGGQGPTADTIFGYRVHWSLGAKTSAAPTATPTGNPLLIIGNPMYLLLGVRSGPETIFIDGRNGLAALTDESILKMRARRGFAPGVEQAFAILEQRA